MRITTIYDENGEPVELPTTFEVCPVCRGKGKSSAYLGAFSYEDMCDDPDFREEYMRGGYDRTCDECHGERVIELIDEDKLTPAQRVLYMEEVENEIAYQKICDMERRMGA